MLPFLLVLLAVLSVAERFNCTNHPIKLAAGDEIVFDIYDASFSLICTYQLIPDLYVVPFINYTSIRLAETDYAFISSDPTRATQGRSLRIPEFDQSGMGPPQSNFSDSLSWIPAAFNVSFKLSNVTCTYGSFFMMIQGKDYTPKHMREIVVDEDGVGTTVDSESFTEESSGVRLSTIQDALQLRVVNYPDLHLNNNSKDSIFIIENDKFLCSALDLLVGGVSASIISESNSFTVFSKTSNPDPGITFLATTAYSFEGLVSVRALWESDGPTELDATVQPQIIHLIAPAGTNTTRYTTHFTFLGSGNLSYYAGAVSKYREELLLEEICADEAPLFVPLEVKGRTRTFILNEGKTLIDISLSKPDDFGLVDIGQKGVFMSNSYPFSSGKKETGEMTLRGPNNEPLLFCLEVFSSGLRPGDLLSLQFTEGEEVTYMNFTQPMRTEITMTGNVLSMKYELGKTSKGLLVRYNIKKAESKRSERMPFLLCWIVLVSLFL